MNWPNGAIAQLFSAEDPESSARPAILRRLVRRAGQVEIAGRDLGHAAVRAAARDRPRQVVTTTPRPIAAAEGLSPIRHG